MGLRGTTSEKHAAQSSEKMRKTFSLNYESPALPLSYRPSASFRINTANDCDQPRKRSFEWDTPTLPDKSALRL